MHRQMTMLPDIAEAFTSVFTIVFFLVPMVGPVVAGVVKLTGQPSLARLSWSLELPTTSLPGFQQDPLVWPIRG